MIKTSRTLLLTSAAVVALSVTPHKAMAGPKGGVVVGGSANISQSGTKTDIHQHSNKAILDWRSFDVTAQDHVEFHQPSSNAMALNRIRDTKPSQIDGKITANGHVMLINPNGVVFGSSSQVDVGSLTATTADIDNDDLMAGRLHFNKAGKLDAAIINEGSITVKEAGLVNLVAPRVENHGVIHAKLGKVQLAAADTFILDMAGDGLLQIAVTEEQAAKLTRNTGRITAEGGTIALIASRARTIVDSLVENSGIIEAHSMTKVGGKVILGGSHTKVSGTIKADGKTSGGEVLIGGDLQGKTIDNVSTAQVTEVSTAVITANATEQGDGGKVIVWADNATRYEGDIEAKGGSNGGDGGFVEVSGKRYLEFLGDADLSGDNLGTLLLDPDEIEIVAGSGNGAHIADGSILFADAGTFGNTTNLGADDVSGRLSSNANLILQANNTIDVNADVTSTGSGDLTLQTGLGGTITVNNAIDVNTGSLTLIADEIDIAASLSGTGDIQLTSADVTQEIEIGSTNAAALNLTAAELANLTDGWNSITIGKNNHLANMTTTDNITFSDNTYIRTSSDNGGIYLNSEITTNDNADLLLRGWGNFGSLEANQALSVAGNLTLQGYRSKVLNGTVFVGGNLTNNAHGVGQVTFMDTLTVNGDMTAVISNSSIINADISVGGNMSLVGVDRNIVIGGSTKTIDIGGNLTATNIIEFNRPDAILNGTINVDGDVNITVHDQSVGEDASIILLSTTQLQADGNINFTSDAITFDPVATISGNADGSSNLTFLEYGEDDAMEIGTTGGNVWQMSASEIATIQDGFNSITFGSTSLTEGIIINDALSFSDHVSMLSGNTTSSYIDINNTITTTDNSDLTLDGISFPSGSGPHGYYGVEIGANLNVARDLNITSGPDFNSSAALITVGRDLNLNSSNATRLDSDYTVGRDFNFLGSNNHHFRLYTGHTIDVARDFTVEKFEFRMDAGSAIEVDGDISIEATQMTLDATASISGNADGSSNLTFLEYGEDAGMEIGGTSAGHAWQMTAAEIATIQNGFNSITFGSSTHAQRIDITGAVSFSDNVNFLNTGNDATITVQDTFTTTDNASARFESGSAANVGWDAINIDADMNIAGDLITRTGTGSGAGHVDVNNTNMMIGGDWTLLSDFGGKLFSTNLNVGGDIIAERGTKISQYIFSSTNGVVGGDFIIDAQRRVRLDGNFNVTGLVNFSNQQNTNLVDIDANLTSGSTIDISGAGNIDITGDMTSNGNITIGSDNNADQIGAIAITGATINTNGGNFIAGGGANPLTTAAYAAQDGVYDIGVELDNTQITTGIGNISIRGEGEDTGNDNYGIYLLNGSTLSATTGAVSLYGTGGAGDDNNYGIYLLDDATQITSVDGNILLRGIGGSVSGFNNHGIYFHDGADIISTGTSVNAATITLDGDASRGSGALINGGTIQSGYGDILINGDSTAGGQGVMISNFDTTALQSRIVSTGDDDIGNAANITINGNSNNTNGVFLHANAGIQTEDGDINITGNGEQSLGALALRFGSYIRSIGTGTNAGRITLNGTSTSSLGFGVNASSYIRSMDGNILISGQGGHSASGDGIGVQIGDHDGTTYGYILSEGMGHITIDATAGNCTGGSCYGFYMDDASGAENYIRTTSTGNINITGRGGNIGSNNYGIFLEGGSYIESTMAGADAGTITLNGTGGNGVNNNHGVYLDGSLTRISSVAGDISIDANGGYATGTGNAGLKVNRSSINSTGLSNLGAGITINAFGGNGTSQNDGLLMSVGAGITSLATGSDTKPINITAVGGNGTTNNRGLVFTNGGDRVTSIDSGININATGRGSSGGRGINLRHGYINSSGLGNVNITANAANSGNDNIGLWVERWNSPLNAEISSNNGDLNIIANGGNNLGTGNHGIFLSDTSNVGGGPTTFKTTGNGNMTITASSGSNPSTYDLYMQDDLGQAGISGLGNGAMTGDITLNINSYYSENANFLQTQGNLTITPRTAGTSIGLGGGAGTLNLTDIELAQFNVGGDLVIGSATAGDVHLDSVDFTGITANAVTLEGADFNIDGVIEAANSITMITNNYMTLNGSVSATGGGNSVVLLSDNFTNNGGASAIDAGAGRYLVYANGPSTTMKGGLAAPHYYNLSYASKPPSSITETGDLFLYSYQPTLSFNADDITLNTFNPNFNSFTYTVSGLEAGDSLPSVFSGNPAFVKSQQSSGIFRINGTLGSLTSLIGYDFAFVPGTLTMLSPAEQIPSTVEYQIQTPDSFLAGNNSFTIAYADSDFVSNPSTGNTTSDAPSAQKQRVQIKRNNQKISDTSSENDAGVRLVEADLLEIERPIIEFYDLCSYNIKYCQ